MGWLRPGPSSSSCGCQPWCVPDGWCYFLEASGRLLMVPWIMHWERRGGGGEGVQGVGVGMG